MEEKNKIKRHYTIGDTEILTFMADIHNSLFGDKVRFISYSHKYEDPFESNWTHKIKLACDVSPHVVSVGTLMDMTDEVQGKMEECSRIYIELKGFVRDAFKDDAAVENEFGFTEYERSRYSAERMYRLTLLLHSSSVKYSQELIAGGLSQAKIDQILLKAEDLNEKIKKQLEFIKRMTATTEERIRIMNDAYDTTRDVCYSGKNIFSDDPVHAKWYLLPHRKGKSNDNGQVK